MKSAVYSKDERQGVSVVDNSSFLSNTTQIPKGFVLCKVVCAGVNPVDAKFQIGDKFPESFEPILRRIMDGKGVGFDFSGIVEECSSEEVDYKIGDEVFGCVPPLYGSLRTKILVPTHQIARKPKRLTHQEAACLPLVGLTSYQSLKVDFELKPNNHLLLIGASGGVGHVALQVAKLIGAKVTAVCSTKNIDLMKSLGADHIVDYATQPILSTLESIVSEYGPFDLCLDSVSSHDSRDTTMFDYKEEILKNNVKLVDGKYITIGGKTYQWFFAGLKRLFSIDLFALFTPGRELFWIRFPYSSDHLKQLSEWADEGKLKPLVSQTFTFDSKGVQDAFEALHSRRVVGKLVVNIQDA